MTKVYSKNRKWIVLIGTAMLTMAMIGIVNNCFSLYIIPVCDDLGLMRSQYTVAQTLIFGFAMLGSIISWRIYKHVSMINCLKACCIIAPLLYFSFSFSTSLAGFYIRAVIIGLCEPLVSSVPVMRFIKQWFPDNYATALGIAFLGSSLGGAAFSKLTDYLLLSFGWRVTYQVLAVIMAVMLLFASFVLVKEKEETIREEVTEAFLDRGRNVTPFESAILVLCTVIAVCGSGCLMYVTTPYYQDMGYSETFAANCASATFILTCAGKPLQGRIIDKKGYSTCLCLAHGGFLISFTALCLFRNWIFVIPVLAGGLFANPYSTVIGLVIPDYLYKKEDRGRAMGWFLAACNGGLAVSPTVSSLVYDFTGSYVSLFAVMIGLSVITLVVFLRILNKKVN